MAGAADQIAKGTLSVIIKPVSQEDRLGIALKTMLEQSRSLVADTGGAAEAVHGGASTIAESVENLSATSNQLSSSVAEITATMEELSASSLQIAEFPDSAVDIATLNWESSKNGCRGDGTAAAPRWRASTTKTKPASTRSSTSAKTSKEISRVMAIINAIADQTKLIAFNAALEAASAGETGRRFGVVAAEICRLADSVTDSTGEIESKVSRIQGFHQPVGHHLGKGGCQHRRRQSHCRPTTAERLGEMVEAASARPTLPPSGFRCQPSTENGGQSGGWSPCGKSPTPASPYRPVHGAVVRGQPRT